MPTRFLYATGRVPNTGSLGLENTSVQMKPDGSVVVDDYSKTDVDSIYAIGDCTNRMQMTPVAIAEGRAVAETLFNNNPMNLTTLMFLCCVQSAESRDGWAHETEARERYIDIDVLQDYLQTLSNVKRPG